MPQDIIIISPDGRRRRARKGEIIQEGERIHFPATLMDAMQSVMADATASDHTIRDGFGHAAGHRPGYAFAASDASLHSAAVHAYVQKCQHLADAWRHRGLVDGGMHEPAHTPDATQLTTDAEQAWQSKKQRLEQAWRQRA